MKPGQVAIFAVAVVISHRRLPVVRPRLDGRAVSGPMIGQVQATIGIAVILVVAWLVGEGLRRD